MHGHAISNRRLLKMLLIKSLLYLPCSKHFVNYLSYQKDSVLCKILYRMHYVYWTTAFNLVPIFLFKNRNHICIFFNSQKKVASNNELLKVRRANSKKIACRLALQWNLYKADKLQSGHFHKTGSVTRNGLLCFAVKLS